MAEAGADDRVASAEFTGTRSELFGLLLRGHLLMLPTIGIYRFWMVTWKRRFYWQNTVIDGDPLEYTGHAMQLLLGFLFAIGFFLPIYIAFFYLSTQTPQIAVLGYSAVGSVLWFLTGYAVYRARDFRLSRTLWRGIRFDQKGSAWGYAFRRFGWSILMVVTAGLIFPFMAGNLWRYRYRHTWYGDRQFTFNGSWRNLAGPYYLVYLSVVILTVATFAYLGASDDFVVIDGDRVPGIGFWLLLLADGFVAGLGYFYFRSRETSRMFSAIRVGDAALTVKVRARSLLGQFLLYLLALCAAGLVFLVLIAIVAGGVVGASISNGKFDPAELLRMFQSGWVTVALLILVYLALLSAFTILGEVILGFGYWALVARNATIKNPASLETVEATAEDTALAGEGLADALNVGAY
jgi:hypothetical protein